MKLYELTLILTPDLSEEEMALSQKKIQSLIQEEDGILTDSKNPLKRKLGYPIKNKEEAFLSTLNFNLAPEKLGGLEKKLRSENQILRYLILTKPRPKISPVEGKKMPVSPKILPSETYKDKKIVKPSKEKKVELKEIEKKLEEMLGE
ncbi:MAG: 30S ribosomal protein S6 [Candidatus Pacebacteria bacterium]|nr:30S ribosomal protein S6 [Candidatus Paceibacterota bacterium]